MTKAQHTPGPWHLEEGRDYNNAEQKELGAGHYFDMCDSNGNTVVVNVSCTQASDETKANARLIAAAPDYFDGCKDLPQITDGESTADYDKRVLAWFYCNAGMIYAANKKAMGEI